jgi:dihydroorotase
MKVLIQSATILDPGSPFHKKKKNVVIQNGKITDISDKKSAADKVINATGMYLTIGWFDLGAYVGDPGYEHKEDLSSLMAAAAAGGFTELALLPNTNPPVQTKNEISYLTRGNPNQLVQLHAIASVTRNNKGEELTEMIDLHENGAVAFTDGLKPVWHTDLFLKALQYVQKFDGLLIDHPEDVFLNSFGQMHEGVQSTMLGLKGMPRIAEELAISRNIELLQYTGGRIHFSRLSTAKALALVKAAKKKGLNVTCDVTGYQPLLEDSVLETFETNYKVNPPIREKADRDALIDGLNDGTVDILCTGHLPQDDESKNLEFDLADFGMTNLQTFGSNLVALSKDIDWPTLLEKVTQAPRRLLNLDVPRIDAEEKANLTLFDPAAVWTLDEKTNLSKGKNSPWFGQKVKGKAIAVFNNGKSLINH